jgi:hypothetical protein
MLCDLVATKNNKLWILQLFWKSVHKTELSRTKFYGFQAKWASYGHNHGIVCSNDLILCTYVYLGMTNNFDLGSFNFRCTKKLFFIFLVQKLGFFVKCLPKICYKNWTTKFYQAVYHILCTIHQLFTWKRFYSHLSKNDKIPPIQLEAGQIWTTGAL